MRLLDCAGPRSTIILQYSSNFAKEMRYEFLICDWHLRTVLTVLQLKMQNANSPTGMQRSVFVGGWKPAVRIFPCSSGAIASSQISSAT